MNWKKHLIISILILLGLSYFFRIKLMSFEIIPLAIAVVIFSLLPDIDHSKSKISSWFRMFYIVLGIYSAYKFFNDDNYVFLISLGLAVVLFIFHLGISENSFKHRKFPHSFTFGIFASIILYVFTDLTTAIIGFCCFFIHLLLDNHILRAFNYDSRFWKGFFRR